MSSVIQCTRCGSVSFYNDDAGNKNCSECHMRFEGFLSQSTEVTAVTIGAQQIRVGKKLDTGDHVKVIEKDNRYHILQRLLKEQVTVLIIHYKFNKQLYQIVGDLWHSYLLSIQQVINQIDELKQQQQSNEDDEETHFNVAAIREKPSPILTLSILYLSLTWLKEPVTPSDLLNMIQEGHLMATIPDITWDGNPSKWCNFIKLQNTAYDLSRYLKFSPRTNMKLLMVRFCTELELPKFILQLSYQLIQVLEIPYVIALNNKDKDKKWDFYINLHHSVNSGVLAAAVIIVLLNMRYNLSQRVEDSEYTEYLESLVEKEMKSLDKDKIEDIFNNTFLEFPVPVNDEEIQEDMKFQFERWLYHRINIVLSSESLSKSNLWDIKDVNTLPKTIPKTIPKYYLHEFINERYQTYIKQYKRNEGDKNNEETISYDFESFFKQPTNDFLCYQNENELLYRPCNKFSSFKGSKKTDYFAILVELFELILGCPKNLIINTVISVERIYYIYSSKLKKQSDGTFKLKLNPNDFLTYFKFAHQSAK